MGMIRVNAIIEMSDIIADLTIDVQQARTNKAKAQAIHVRAPWMYRRHKLRMYCMDKNKKTDAV